MSPTVRRSRRHKRGAALLGAIVFVLIISICLAGAAQLSVSHYERAQVESDYASVLALTEAGVNYELRKISTNANNADQVSVSNPQGVTYSFGNGTFRVYCTNRDGSTPWNPPNNLYVVSTGTVNGVSRTIKASVKGISNSAQYALYGVNQGIINGTAATVGGSVGTNGFFTFNGHPTIQGSVDFNGPGANWQSPPNGTYTVNYNPSPISWPTVDSLANTQFPSGGLAWLATHNDNALASPAISGNSVLINGNGSLTLKGKPGGANYYVTSLTCNGNAKVTFDNTNGPINVWMGPSGSSGTFVFNGGTAAIKMSQDPTKAVRMYVATTNDVILNGHSELDAGVYNYNGSSSGRVIFNGNPDVYGSVISNMFTLNGNPDINFIPGFFQSNGTVAYYGFDNSWLELNNVNQ